MLIKMLVNILPCFSWLRVNFECMLKKTEILNVTSCKARAQRCAQLVSTIHFYTNSILAKVALLQYRNCDFHWIAVLHTYCRLSWFLLLNCWSTHTASSNKIYVRNQRVRNFQMWHMYVWLCDHASKYSSTFVKGFIQLSRITVLCKHLGNS